MNHNDKGCRGFLLGTAAIAALHCATPAASNPQQMRTFHLVPQDLSSALRTVGREAGREIMFPSEAVAGKKAPALDGTMTADQAVTKLLEGSGLSADFREDVILIRGRSAAASSEVAGETRSDIVVTGSRIRGATIASPVITLTQSDFQAAGENNLPDVVRDIPQNFGGGQNPGIGALVPQTSGINVSGASTINLRGLGPDATLTLLNGHRLAFNASRQSIDISAIPLLAVDRLEVVADGSSALYGSDAVAGVANVILRRDYDGVETSARLGSATDGGDEQQQYDVMAGRHWGSGGFLAAYEFERDTAVFARQRSYASGQNPEMTLYPPMRHHNFLLTGHQALTDRLTFSVDTLYNKRWQSNAIGLTATTPPTASGLIFHARDEVFAIAPSLQLALGSNWRATLASTYGLDRAHYRTDYYAGGQASGASGGCYCNQAASVELNADGSLFSLPGGNVRAALGGGYRANIFHSTTLSGNSIRVTQNIYYAFGELNIPLASPRQDIPLVHRLDFSAAARYEDYPGVARVVSPKLGFVYAPTADFDIKGSWGKSFKAPTQFQQYNAQGATLYTAAQLGGTGYPSTATAILIAGGNPNLKPEHARTWTATLDVHPRALPGARVQLTYFKTIYRDRIVVPIAFTSQALSNPEYATLVTLNPSEAQKAAAVATGDFSSLVSGPYDPTNVVAIVTNNYLNVASQNIHGVDLQADYTTSLGRYGTLTFRAFGTYLHSEQRLSSLQPLTQLAGTIYNPPHYRGRGGFTWTLGSMSVSGFVNYTGAMRDTRSTQGAHVSSSTTADISAHYDVKSGPSPFRNIGLSLSVQNLLNRKPSLARAQGPYDTPYDSTNYAPIGRFISLGISKRW